MSERSEANNCVVFASRSPHCSSLLCNSKALRRIASVLAAYAEDKCAPTVMAACEAGADGSSEDQLASTEEVTRMGRRRTLV